MKEIVSKSVSPKWLKRRKKDEASLTLYWSNLYPSDYAKDMTRDYQKEALLKVDSFLRKFASDAVDVVFQGEIRQASDGFVFVDIPNAIFSGFLPLLGSDAEKPPKNERHYDDIGAHITVIKRREIVDNSISFNDVGKVISYKMKGVQKVENPDGWEEMEAVWFIPGEAPELESVRKSYGLSPRILDHDFHITLGVKRRPVEDVSYA